MLSICETEVLYKILMSVCERELDLVDIFVGLLLHVFALIETDPCRKAECTSGKDWIAENLGFVLELNVFVPSGKVNFRNSQRFFFFHK